MPSLHFEGMAYCTSCKERTPERQVWRGLLVWWPEDYNLELWAGAVVLAEVHIDTRTLRTKRVYRHVLHMRCR